MGRWIKGKYADWEPLMEERTTYCPFCGKPMKLIEHEKDRGLWSCEEHGGWDSYHPYPRFTIEKWPKRQR